MWLACVQAVLATPADDAYLQARDAWERGEWREAYHLSLAALEEDPQHPPSRLLEAFTLIHMNRVRDAMEILDALVKDPVVLDQAPEVSRLAVQSIRQFADRWRRDQWSLSGGAILRGERAYGYDSWVGGLAFEGWLPATPRLGVRLDVTTPFNAADTLAIDGPVFGVMGVVQQPLGSGIWHLDAALGPSVWVGRSSYWDGRYRGLFPGVRGAAAVDVRPWQYVGFRVEGGYTVHHGAREGLGFWSHGGDVRVMTTGYGRSRLR